MSCNPEVFKHVPLFSLLDDDEMAILAAQVELKQFAPRQRIYKIGGSDGQAYVMVSGHVRATAVDEAVCIEVSRDDIAVLIARKPHAGMDMLTVLGRQFHNAQQLVRLRATRNVNELIEEEETFAEKTADSMVQIAGSWTFIIVFLAVSALYAIANLVLGHSAWHPYPFILLNLMLSMLAAIQAPVILMSQNRQDMKDRVRGELDFAVNRRAESEIQGLAQKLNSLDEKMSDLQDLLRK